MQKVFYNGSNVITGFEPQRIGSGFEPASQEDLFDSLISGSDVYRLNESIV